MQIPENIASLLRNNAPSNYVYKRFEEWVEAHLKEATTDDILNFFNCFIAGGNAAIENLS